MAWVDEDKCVGCGSCVDACPIPGAVVVVDDMASVEQEVCTDCGACVSACGQGAMMPGRPDTAGNRPTKIEATGTRTIQLDPQEMEGPQQPTSGRPPRQGVAEGAPTWVRILGKVLGGLVHADLEGGNGGRGADGGGRGQRMRRGRDGGGGRGRRRWTG